MDKVFLLAGAMRKYSYNRCNIHGVDIFTQLLSPERVRVVTFAFLTFDIVLVLKIIVAIMLLKSTEGAIKLAIIEACIYFALCGFSLYSSVFKNQNEETDTAAIVAAAIQILILIPYAVKLFQIKDAWRNIIPGPSGA